MLLFASFPRQYGQLWRRSAVGFRCRALAAALVMLLPTLARPVEVMPEEMVEVRRWIAARFEAPEQNDPPFSFTYGGKSSVELLKNWERELDSRKLDDTRTEHTLSYRDPRTGLVVRCVVVEYRDFPSVEWTLYFKNTGSADTPILADIQALDTILQRSTDAEFVLHHAVGSPANGSDYGPLQTPLGPRARKRISAAGGRPTNTDMSYFNLQSGEQGMILAVGWPAQWAAEFVRGAAQGIHIRAGQELTRFKLLPGEEVRSPLIVLQFWRGDRVRSQNIWRRWMMAHGMPKPGGELPPPQFVASSSRAYEEMIGANEANQIMHIDRYLEEKLKIDYWWMDAGWYVQQHGWPQVGTWQIDPKRFPRGFKPISDHAHARDVKILVWFEPERVTPGTWLYENRPQWLLTLPADQSDPLAGLCGRHAEELGSMDPCVSHNPTEHTRSMAKIRWTPGRLSLHPGPKGEYSVVRWTAPESGRYDLEAVFLAIDEETTTDVHVLQGGQPLFKGMINLDGQGPQATYKRELAIEKGDTLDFVVGFGNGTYISDSTGLEVSLRSTSEENFDAAGQFDVEKNPNGAWSYGYLQPGAKPDSSTFHLYGSYQVRGADGQRLLNLGDPEARNWLTNHVDKLLTEQGIDLYRQDFNIDPLPYWRAADAEDRQGITEIRYVEGFLAFWDELRRRHPKMLIDTCASGGRRNDLETLRRSVPLWRSDYAFEPVGHQCMTYGISSWIPYHGTGTVACADAPYYGGDWTPVEPYAFWSNAAPSLGSGIDVRVPNIDYDALRRLVGQWRKTSSCYYGDFYPLTTYSRKGDAWIAWQFDRPDLGQGMVQAFRRKDSKSESSHFKLRGLDPSTRYRLTTFDVPGTIERTGRALMDEGLSVSIKDPPAAAVITYERSGPN